nr:hypothetical protein GCM10020092_077380 [Actinoplanes digitatis]
MTKTASSPSTSLRRGTRAVAAAITGAPTTTPSAYAVMVQPPCATASAGDSE